MVSLEKELRQVKNRYEIVGNSPLLNLALETALKVAPTDMSVLITGESGVGKEVFSKIIHQHSLRKHGPFIAVNCGAIPEGTIDSELFGHEKGAFTGATDARKGYFETVNGGTIFLDEVGELPLGTQARLLRVLETGEYIRVGSSKIQKTNVRVVAATNRLLLDQADKGRFRVDLYYRLATVPIVIPRLSERKEDIYLMFAKFVNDFVEKYHTVFPELDEGAKSVLENYPWPGNIRQLRNVTEQICVLESGKLLDAFRIKQYLPPVNTPSANTLNPSGGSDRQGSGENFTERDLLYKVLFDLKRDMSDLKKLVFKLIESGQNQSSFIRENQDTIRTIFSDEMHAVKELLVDSQRALPVSSTMPADDSSIQDYTDAFSAVPLNRTISIEETKTIHEQERDMIKKSLDRHRGRRKKAALELGISERTLYRKIKQYGLE
jgi:DNA-binding NtrC family response regulator